MKTKNILLLGAALVMTTTLGMAQVTPAPTPTAPSHPPTPTETTTTSQPNAAGVPPVQYPPGQYPSGGPNQNTNASGQYVPNGRTGATAPQTALPSTPAATADAPALPPGTASAATAAQQYQAEQNHVQQMQGRSLPDNAPPGTQPYGQIQPPRFTNSTAPFITNNNQPFINNNAPMMTNSAAPPN